MTNRRESLLELAKKIAEETGGNESQIVALLFEHFSLGRKKLEDSFAATLRSKIGK